MSETPETGTRNAELRRLQKINRALMSRMERDMDPQAGSAFSMFQNAIMLEQKVCERTAELSRLTQRLLQEVSERRDTEMALRLAKIGAEQANLGKTRFLAAASHDLHQPLNAARLFLDALGSEVAEGRPRALVARAEAALETVNEMLDTLLDISRLDAGAWPIHVDSFPIAPLVTRLLDEYVPQAEACGLHLTTVPSAAVLHTDRALFERVLRNLIGNAVRYTQAGRILIGCRRQRQSLRVEVWDTGIGIPHDQLDHVFEEFRQLDNNPRREDKGLGLGLAIVRRIARMLDLRVEVRSTVGRGSCFSVTVPLGTVSSLPVKLPRPTPQGQPGLSGLVVAVIDNDPLALEALSSLLESWSCHPVAAVSAIDLMARMDELQLRPGLIMANDPCGDGKVGLEAVQIVRNHRGCIPALITATHGSAELKAKAAAMDCGYLTKPANPAKLRSLLSYLVSRAARPQ